MISQPSTFRPSSPAINTNSYDVSALYLPTYYALKLPEIFLLGIASSVVSLGVAVRSDDSGDRRRCGS